MPDSMRYSAGPFQSDMVKCSGRGVSEKLFDVGIGMDEDGMLYS